MKKKTQKNRSESGQSLVELTLGLTVLLTLLVGTVEIGIAMFQYVQLRDAAQEGAIYGAINPGDFPGIINHVKAASNTPIDLQNDAEVSIIPSVEGEICEGSPITVEVTYPHKISMPFVSAFLGSNTIPINASVTGTILIPIC